MLSTRGRCYRPRRLCISDDNDNTFCTSKDLLPMLITNAVNNKQQNFLSVRRIAAAVSKMIISQLKTSLTLHCSDAIGLMTGMVYPAC